MKIMRNPGAEVAFANTRPITAAVFVLRYRKPMLLSFLLCSLLALLPVHCPAQAAEKARTILENGTHQKRAGSRVAAVRVLGLLPQDEQAAQMAENALKDSSPLVRAAAATALGQMHASEAAEELKQMLNDKDLHVEMAAAHALQQLNDPACYEVYYALLTGERKGDSGLIAQEMKILHDPKQVAEMGFNERIGFVPFASAGWGAVETVMKDRKSGTAAKAALISALATDPDPRANDVFVTATQNKKWVIRVAALEAIAKRENPALSPKIEESLNDSRNDVKYTSAAAIIRLDDVAKARQATAVSRSPQPSPLEQSANCAVNSHAAGGSTSGGADCLRYPPIDAALPLQ
jgi:HEAT repeat protein